MAEDKEAKNKSLTDKIADKIAPEPVKPTTALQKKLATNQSNSLKKRLLIHTDEDSDEDSETFVNPVAKNDTEAKKYVPPPLNIAAINDSVTNDIDRLAATPRSNLSASQRQAVDREAVLDAISQRSDPNMLEKVTPKNG